MASPPTRSRPLAQILARQWVLFTLCVAALFCAGALLLLFVLEDSFIDRRLREVAATIDDLDHARLPPRFELWPADAAPAAIASRVQHLRSGGIAEFRLPDGRYVHVLRGEDGRRRPLVLVHDVSAELAVNAGLRALAPWLALLLLALAAIAHLLSRRFVRQLTRHTRGLLEHIHADADPQALRRRADHEPVQELATFAYRIADAWEARLAALQREADTVAFLAHELRTPLQSARTSLALVDEHGQLGGAALARLARAVSRLQRASAAVLWLSSEADPRRERSELTPLLQGLVAELQPQAGARGQALQLQLVGDPRWAGPAEVLETVLANLLLNAIRHGGAAAIVVQADAERIVIRNRAAEDPCGGDGFGIGLRIVERLCARCGWTLAIVDGGDDVICEVRATPAEATDAV